MKPEKQLEKAQSLLSQALSVALNSMPNNSSVIEAKGHIKQAMNKLDKAQKSQTRKRSLSSSQFETWWGNVQSGTAMASHAPMTGEARNRALNQLNSMIKEEEDKLSELDKNQPQIQNELLND